MKTRIPESENLNASSLPGAIQDTTTAMPLELSRTGYRRNLLLSPDVLKTIGNRLARVLSNAFFPGTCFVCNAFINNKKAAKNGLTRAEQARLSSHAPERVFSAVMTHYLCHDCTAGFRPVTSPRCTRCGIQFLSKTGEDRLCGQCLSTRKPFVRALSCGQHEGVLSKLIHAYKYNGKTALGRPLGTLLHIHYLQNYLETPIDFVIPVPLHREKRIKRGFDQVSYMLYHWPWTKTNGQCCIENGTILADNILLRHRNTGSQAGLGRKNRGENIKKAFALTDDSGRLENKRVLLIDDVYTTGATLEECALALKQGGASHVYFLTLSRAM